jgi:hypothetical protein
VPKSSTACASAAGLTGEARVEVDLAVVDEDVRIGVRGHGQVPLADVLPDPCPSHAAQVKEADPTMPDVVGTEHRNPGRGACPGDRCSEASPPKPWKTGRSGVRSSRATSATMASKTMGGTLTRRALDVDAG